MLDEEIKKYKFKATIEYERFYSEESLFGVYTATISKEEQSNIPKDAIIYNTITITGAMQKLLIGCEYIFSDMLFSYNKKYDSYQMKTGVITAQVPSGAEEQEMFLSLITTPLRARTLINAYPNIVNEVINNEDSIDFKKTKGIKEKTWIKIRSNILEHYVLSEIMVMLQPLGVTFTAIKRLVESEESPAILKKKLEDNPYILTNVRGFGFKRVDGIVLKLKPELRESTYRLSAFLQDLFVEMGANSGDTYITEKELKSEITNTIPECLSIYEKKNKEIEYMLHRYKDLIGYKPYFECEESIFGILKDLDKHHQNWILDVSAAIEISQKQQGFEYNENQIKAIQDTLNHSVALITGKAGVGKSTVIRAVMNAYRQSGYVVSTTALSAKAVGRITEATGIRASTIHRLLEWDGRAFAHNADNPLECDVLMLDEASMVGAELFMLLLRAVATGKRVVIIGDDHQLPPIGFGNIFSDLLSCGEFCVSRLSKVMRQAERSGILTDANMIRKQKSPLSGPVDMQWRGELKDMCYMFKENQTSIREIAVRSYMKAVEEVGLDEAVLLVPKRKDSMNSVNELNTFILDRMIPNPDKKLPEIVVGHNIFRIGAKVIQRKNDYVRKIFNGDMGIITNIKEELDEDDPRVKMIMCTIRFNILGQLIEASYSRSEMLDVDLAYAMSVHLAQGSAFHTVIGICDNSHMFMLDSCLMYTLITRAKSRCVLLTQESAFNKGVHTNKSRNRKTWLSLRRK